MAEERATLNSHVSGLEQQQTAGPGISSDQSMIEQDRIPNEHEQDEYIVRNQPTIGIPATHTVLYSTREDPPGSGWSRD